MKLTFCADHAGGTVDFDSTNRADLAPAAAALTVLAAGDDTAVILLPLGAGRYERVHAADVDRIDLTWEP